MVGSTGEWQAPEAIKAEGSRGEWWAVDLNGCTSEWWVARGKWWVPLARGKWWAPDANDRHQMQMMGTRGK